MRTPLRILAATLSLAITTAALPAQTASDRLDLDRYLDLQTVGDVAISPDGRTVVYTRGWIDAQNDARKSHLWVMDADGSRSRFLAEGSAPRWSPDGTRIAYVQQGEPGGAQIHVRWMDAEGATSQITRLEHTPRDIAWSPDGRRIAFRMHVPTRDPSWNIDLPRRPDGATWTEAPRIVTDLQYRRDREGFRDPGFNHLFVVSAEGGAPRQVTSGDWEHGSFDWMGDGERIVFESLRVEGAEHRYRESELYTVDLRTGQVSQLTDRHGHDGSPVVSPDGRRIAYRGYDFSRDTYLVPDVYVMEADGSSPRSLTADFDRDPRDLFWAPDGSGVYFLAEDRGERQLFFAPLSGRGGVRAVTEGTHILRVTDVSRNGRAVGSLSSFHEPGDVVAFDLRRPRIERLTGVNDDLLAGVRLGEVEEIWYEAPDGWDIQGWLVKPPDFNPERRYPLMLTIHGGPHAMYGVGFNYGWQNHAAEGYLVLYTNPRGSSGYGKEFGNAINNAYPGDDYHDLMAGVDAVVARGYVDERNMFVYGCSGGGVLTAWTVAHTDRFAAASSNCPVVNWLSFVGTTDGATWYRNFEKLPWEDPSEHLQRSPLMYVHQVSTPTMLMTGVDDLRTPMAQTEEYYQALRFLGVPTAMVRFNDEWHGTGSKPSNFMRTQLYLRSWFERWTTRDGAVAAD
jgi:dipeptidyl aminopeptidase/acylaminoacyl peptidase